MLPIWLENALDAFFISKLDGAILSQNEALPAKVLAWQPLILRLHIFRATYPTNVLRLKAIFTDSL